MSLLELFLVFLLTLSGVLISGTLIFLGIEYHFGIKEGLHGLISFPTALVYLFFTYRSLLHYIDLLHP